MSGLPPIPPRPDRTKARSPAPASPAGGNSSTLGSDIPVIPPRPKRRIDRSQSPSKAQSSFTGEPPAIAPIMPAPNINIPTEDGSDLVALEKTPTFPPTLQVPKMSDPAPERGEEHTPVPEIRTIPNDLELQAPAPTLPKNADTDKSEMLAEITRTDSARVAELELESANEEDKAACAATPQLRPETHAAIMESVGQPEAQPESQPQTVREMEDQLEQIDPGFPGTAEIPRKKVEVGDSGVVHVGTRDSVAEAVLKSEAVSEEEELVQRNEERKREADGSSHLGLISAPEDMPQEPVSSSVEKAGPASHEENVHVNTSGNQLEQTPNNAEDAFRDTVPVSERQADIEQFTPAPELEKSGKDAETKAEEQKPQSGIEHYVTSDVKEDNVEDTPAPAPEEPHATDKNEHDEILGEPAEVVDAETLSRESAILSDSDSKEASKENSPQEVWQAPQSSLDNVSDVTGAHIDTHLPEERPTTGAVAFHQEKQAEGIPLSYEEGRATTGVSSVIKPAIPPRPVKKLTDPKHPELNANPIRVPNLAPVSPQSDGPPPTEHSPILPAGPKPPVPLASKPVIPPRPARPPRPVKKESLNGSEGAPLAKVSSASSARSLFETSGPDAIAAAKAKTKPPVPARPIGNKIAALQGGFLSELNKKIGAGPTALVKEEKKEEEKEAPKEAKPLADARKGRARGPARRAPAKVVKETSPRAATPTLALVQGLCFSQTTTVWEVSPEEGYVKVPSRATSPEPEKSERAKGKEPELVVMDDAPKVTPKIAKDTLEVTKEMGKELEEAEEATKIDAPPDQSALETAQQLVPTAENRGEKLPAGPANPGWTGTTALGAVAMSAQEVVAETAKSVSKTIKDFTEGEEHVLSDVDDHVSPTPSEDGSMPTSPKVSQNDGPSEVEAKTEELAAPENAAEPLGAATAGIPSAEPPKLEETQHRPEAPQHPSETDHPPPCTSGEAPTLSRTGTPSSLEEKAAELMKPENASEPLNVRTGDVPSAVPPQVFAGNVPQPATAPTSPPQANDKSDYEIVDDVTGGGANSSVLERAPEPATTSPVMVRGGVVMESDAQEPGQTADDADPEMTPLAAAMSQETVQTGGEDEGRITKLGAMMLEGDDGLDGKAGAKFE